MTPEAITAAARPREYQSKKRTVLRIDTTPNMDGQLPAGTTQKEVPFGFIYEDGGSDASLIVKEDNGARLVIRALTNRAISPFSETERRLYFNEALVAVMPEGYFGNKTIQKNMKFREKVTTLKEMAALELSEFYERAGLAGVNDLVNGAAQAISAGLARKASAEELAKHVLFLRYGGTMAIEYAAVKKLRQFQNQEPDGNDFAHLLESKGAIVKILRQVSPAEASEFLSNISMLFARMALDIRSTIYEQTTTSMLENETLKKSMGVNRSNRVSVGRLLALFSNLNTETVEDSFKLAKLLHTVATDAGYDEEDIKDFIAAWLGITKEGQLLDPTPLALPKAAAAPAAVSVENMSLGSRSSSAKYEETIVDDKSGDVAAYLNRGVRKLQHLKTAIDALSRGVPKATQKPTVTTGSIFATNVGQKKQVVTGSIGGAVKSAPPPSAKTPELPRLVRGALNLEEMEILAQLEAVGAKISLTPAFRRVQQILQIMQGQLAGLDDFSEKLKEIQAEIVGYDEHSPTGVINGSKEVLPGTIGYFRSGDKICAEAEESANLIVYDPHTGNGVFISIDDHLPRQAINAAIKHFIQRNPGCEGRLYASIIGPKVDLRQMPEFVNEDVIKADAVVNDVQIRNLMEAIAACASNTYGNNKITIRSAHIGDLKQPKYFCMVATDGVPQFKVGKAEKRAVFHDGFSALRRFSSKPHETNIAFDNAGGFAPYLISSSQLNFLVDAQRNAPRIEMLMLHMERMGVPNNLIPALAISTHKMLAHYELIIGSCIYRPCDQAHQRVRAREADFDKRQTLDLSQICVQLIVGDGSRPWNSRYISAVERCFVKGADARTTVTLEPVLEVERQIAAEARSKFNVVELATGRAESLKRTAPVPGQPAVSAVCV